MLISWFIRTSLAALLLIAAVGKLRARDALARLSETVSALGIPARHAAWTARTVVLTELGLGVGLLLPAAAPAAAVGAVLLFAAFTVGLARALSLPAPTTCNCFGATGTPVSARHVVRNTVLTVAALAGLLAVMRWPTTVPTPAPAVLVGAAGLVLAVAVTQLDRLTGRPVRPDALTNGVLK